MRKIAVAVLLGLAVAGLAVAPSVAAQKPGDLVPSLGDDCNGVVDANCTCTYEDVAGTCKPGQECAVWVAGLCLVGG